MSLRPCLIALLCGLAQLLPASATAADVRITLLQVNDVYQTTPVDKGKRGGLARLATLKERVQAESPHTLMVLGGDTLSPSVASNTFKGAQMVAAWNALPLDLAVLGNHEFDFGPQVLRQRLAESRFTWLGANVLERRSGQLLPGLKGSEVRRLGGVKVGFLGVLTADTAHASKPGPTVRFADPLAAARREAARLRAAGARVVVALTHLTLEDDRKLARSGVADVILGGHEHTLLQSLAGRTPIFKMGSDARTLGRIDLVVDSRSKRLKHVDWEAIPVTADIPDEPRTAAVVAEYEQRLSELLDGEVGETAVELDARQASNRSRETNLGNYVADVYRRITGADVAIVNGGSIRSNTTYGPGRLRKRDLLAILPFENPIVKLELTGKQLRAALEHGLAEIGTATESGRFPQVSGLQLSYDPRRPAGQRITQLTVAGAPADDNGRYSVAISGYLASGGDGYTQFKDARTLISLEDALVEPAEMINALAADSPIAPQVQGRIRRADAPPGP